MNNWINWIFHGAPHPWFRFYIGADIMHPHFGLTREQAEKYLGPWEEWHDMPMTLVSFRLMDRGWLVRSPMITDTLWEIKKGVLPRVDTIQLGPKGTIIQEKPAGGQYL